MPETASAQDDLVRVIDQELLGILRNFQQANVGLLAESLKVTATAVRQRLERLLDAGLIEREKVVGNGRGRPTFTYSLTRSGLRLAGADYGALAEAMWLEILDLPDLRLRRNLLRRIAHRLALQYTPELSPDLPLADRLQILSELLSAKKIPAGVEGDPGLPILDVHVCPYPDLASVDSQREMCHLEEEMLSEALGQPVRLSRCRLDGDSRCQFSPES